MCMHKPRGERERERERSDQAAIARTEEDSIRAELMAKFAEESLPGLLPASPAKRVQCRTCRERPAVGPGRGIRSPDGDGLAEARRRGGSPREPGPGGAPRRPPFPSRAGPGRPRRADGRAQAPHEAAGAQARGPLPHRGSPPLSGSEDGAIEVKPLELVKLAGAMQS